MERMDRFNVDVGNVPSRPGKIEQQPLMRESISPPLTAHPANESPQDSPSFLPKIFHSYEQLWNEYYSEIIISIVAIIVISLTPFVVRFIKRKFSRRSDSRPDLLEPEVISLEEV